ncbi:hypothetical protein HYV21_01155 [Candidatus Microgenomates bacterium]|nr:hypothetical protein [Candidatus Microgenomates bacterium]
MRIEILLSQRLSRRQLFESAQKSALMAAFAPHELGKLIGLFLENEEKLAYYRREFEEVVVPLFLEHYGTIAKLRPSGVLGNLDILRTYYVFHRVAQDAYYVPWYLPWMLQDAESTCSLDPRTYVIRNGQYGTMQRYIPDHPDSEVEKAVRGHEWLAQYDNSDDWREILWGAWKLDRDALDAYGKNPEKEAQQSYWTLEDAIRSYLGVGPDNYEGQVRVQRFQQLRDIFGYRVDRTARNSLYLFQTNSPAIAATTKITPSVAPMAARPGIKL